MKAKTTYTVKELGNLLGVKKSISRMNEKEIKESQTALALVRANVDFLSPEGKRLKELAMDLRDALVVLKRNSLSATERITTAPAPGRTMNSLGWKHEEMVAG